jgi:hypothetical protein
MATNRQNGCCQDMSRSKARSRIVRAAVAPNQSRGWPIPRRSFARSVNVSSKSGKPIIPVPANPLRSTCARRAQRPKRARPGATRYKRRRRRQLLRTPRKVNDHPRASHRALATGHSDHLLTARGRKLSARARDPRGVSEYRARLGGLALENSGSLWFQGQRR